MPLRVRKNLAGPPPPECPLSLCMKLLGGAWTPNVIWCLSAGPRRFGELRIDIPPISAKVLSARLRHLEADGVVLRRVLPTSPPSVEYSLTPLGGELIPVIDSIVRVGRRLKSIAAESAHPDRQPHAPRRVPAAKPQRRRSTGATAQAAP